MNARRRLLFALTVAACVGSSAPARATGPVSWIDAAGASAFVFIFTAPLDIYLAVTNGRLDWGSRESRTWAIVGGYISGGLSLAIGLSWLTNVPSTERRSRGLLLLMGIAQTAVGAATLALTIWGHTQSWSPPDSGFRASPLTFSLSF
ncbi:MAG: hypothetical protein HYY84_15535 [Deltaproteobacteria bacterium]|nr:hypothetical protein [Deltaproteobacteria bacterium]